MDYIYILIAALVGATIAGLLGWMKEGTAWNTKKFLESILSGIGAAVLYAIAFSFEPKGVTVINILSAVAWGIAGDNVVNRVIGAAKKS